jgi:hypothetical protein
VVGFELDLALIPFWGPAIDSFARSIKQATYLFFRGRCSPWWTYASFTIARHRSLPFCWDSTIKAFNGGGVIDLTPNPQPEGAGYPFLSESSRLNCPAWEILPVGQIVHSSAKLRMRGSIPPYFLIYLFNALRSSDYMRSSVRIINSVLLVVYLTMLSVLVVG